MLLPRFCEAEGSAPLNFGANSHQRKALGTQRDQGHKKSKAASICFLLLPLRPVAAGFYLNFQRLDSAPPRERKIGKISVQIKLAFSFLSLYDVSMKSIRDILRETMEEYTQIRANELAILRFCQAPTARKKPESVELEREGLSIGADR